MGSEVRPLLLVVLDGFGFREETDGNAIAAAKMPFYHGLLKSAPHSLLDASGEAVGLPKGTMGNSEVGHLTLGSGRIVYQDYAIINKAVGDGSFFSNKCVQELMRKAKLRNATLHLMGLLSDAGVHAHIGHLLALIGMAKKFGVKTAVHLFTDGRDMDPHSAPGLVRMVEVAVEGAKNIAIATVEGRYYAMDRDKRWNRTRKAYRVVVLGEGEKAASASAAVAAAYVRGESDEFITPTVIGDYGGFGSSDYVFFFNFRADRARQLCWAFTQKPFSGFALARVSVNLATMTSYDNSIGVPVAFPPEHPEKVMAEVISNAGLRQLHIAETEKYAHVTYFFNGGVEKPFPNEDRVLVPSRKVSTYDLVPGMGAEQIANNVIEGIRKRYPFILVNFANPDMVGHTGKFSATLRGLAVVDRCIGRIASEAREKFDIVITADHGNCEEIVGNLTTAHTTNKVPIIILSGRRLNLRDGGLSDVAPTCLKLMGVEVPEEMTGRPLFQPPGGRRRQKV